MLVYLLTSSLRDFLRPKKVLAFLLIGILLAFAAKQWANISGIESLSDQYAQASSLIVFRLLGLIAAIFSMSVVAQEVEQKTIVYLITRPIPRIYLALMRMLAAAIATIIVTFVSAVCVSAAIYGFKALSNPMLFRDLLAISMGSMAYTAVFTFVSLILNRALLVDLIYAFGWEMAIPAMPGYLFYSSIYSHISSLSKHPTPPPSAQGALFLTGAAGGHSVSQFTAFMILGGIAVAFGALSCWWFSYFEYIPREDSE